jgi:hypothetical protein
MPNRRLALWSVLHRTAARRRSRLRETRPRAAAPFRKEAAMTDITKACATALLVAAIAPSVNAAQAGGSPKDQPLRAQVSPSYAFAPSTVRIRAFVLPDAENRELEIVVDSASYYRSSTIELSGAQAARAYDVVFVSVPAGLHEVRVVLKVSGGEVRAILYHRVTLFE